LNIDALRPRANLEGCGSRFNLIPYLTLHYLSLLYLLQPIVEPIVAKISAKRACPVKFLRAGVH
jgi:hypothetical protein